MSQWTRHHRGDCPVCQGERKDCRTSDRGITHCRSGEPAPAGLQFIGEDSIGFGMYGPSDGQQNRADFERWQREREAQRHQEQAQRAKSMPVEQRDYHYRKLQNLLKLHPNDKANVLKRGLSEERITELGYRSVIQWQPLGYQFPSNLPGVKQNGESLLNPEPGILIPVPDAEGRIQTYQVRSSLPDTTAKYQWLKNPHLPNGELPVGVSCPAELKNTAIIGTSEGYFKGQIAADRHGITFIGAAGGNFAASPTETLKAVAAVRAKLGTNAQLVLFPDAGSIRNPNIMRAYQGLHELFPDLVVAWWGQAEKSVGDVDEIPSGTAWKLITFAEFEAIAQPTPQEEPDPGEPDRQADEQYRRETIDREQCEQAEAEERKRQQRENYLAEIEAIQHRLNSLSPEPDEVLNQPFLPELKPLIGKITLISSLTGTRKTTRLLELASQARADGRAVIWLGSQNAYLEQTSAEGDISHIHDWDKNDWANLNQRQTDLVLTGCVHSLFKVPIDAIPPGSLLVLDEVEAIVKTLTLKGLGSLQATIVQHFRAVIHRILSTGGRVVGAQNRITNITYDFLRDISGAEINLAVNEYQGEPVPIALTRTGTLPGFTECVILPKLREGKRLIIGSTSQNFCETLEAIVAKLFPTLKVVRYDQKTKDLPELKGFRKNAQAFLEANRPDVLIYSPSAGYGVNIHGSGLFDERIAVLNSGELDDAVQLPARERDGLPLTIFTVKSSHYGDERLSCDPRGLEKGYAINARHTAKIAGVEADLQAAIEAGDVLATQEQSQLQAMWQPDNLSSLIAKYSSQFEARRNYSQLHLADQIEAYYRERGNEVTVYKGHQASVAFRDLWKKTKAEIAARSAVEFAGLPALFRDRNEALRVKNSGKSTYLERISADKYLIKGRFPGVDFNRADFVLETVISDRQRFLKTTELLFLCRNPHIAAKLDNATYRARLKDPFVVRHQLTHHRLKATLFERLGLDKVINHIAPQELRDQFRNASPDDRQGRGFQVEVKEPLREFALSDDSPQLQQLKSEALKLRKEIYRLFRLTIREEQSATAIANKLLKKFGYELLEFERLGNADRQRTYLVSPQGTEAYRQELYKALEAKYRELCSDSVQNLQEDQKPILQKLDVTPERLTLVGSTHSPPRTYPPSTRVKWGQRAGEWVVQHCGTAIAILTGADGTLEWSAELADLEAVA